MIDESDLTLLRQLLQVLVCPVSKGRLTFNAETEELFSADARLAYPIRNGMPVLLPDQARKVEP